MKDSEAKAKTIQCIESIKEAMLKYQDEIDVQSSNIDKDIVDNLYLDHLKNVVVDLDEVRQIVEKYGSEYFRKRATWQRF